MSKGKGSATSPGAFTTGLKERHYRGFSKNGKRLAAKAETARKRRISWLKREHPTNKKAQALAAKLERCTPKHRCRSGACPACAQAAQEVFVEMVNELIIQELQP